MQYYAITLSSPRVNLGWETPHRHYFFTGIRSPWVLRPIANLFQTMVLPRHDSHYSCRNPKEFSSRDLLTLAKDAER